MGEVPAVYSLTKSACTHMCVHLCVRILKDCDHPTEVTEGIGYLCIFFRVTLLSVLNNLVYIIGYLSQKIFTIFFSQSYPIVNTRKVDTRHYHYPVTSPPFGIVMELSLGE